MMQLVLWAVPIGYTTADRWLTGIAWVGIMVIAAVVLVASSVRPPRLSR
jgi:hypothetical protein